MRSGASGSPRCSCSSESARLRELWSPARRRRWRLNASRALLSPSGAAPCDRRAGGHGSSPATHAAASATPGTARGRRVRSARAPVGHALGRVLTVELLEDAVDQASRREVLDLVEHEPLATDDAAPPDVEDLHRRLQLVVGEADDSRSSLRSATICWRSIERRTAPRRSRRRAPSRTPGPRRLAHLLVEALDDRGRVTLEELAELLDEFPMRARRSRRRKVPSTSRCGTAGTGGRGAVLLELLRAARADREGAQQLVERLADGIAWA